MKINFDAFGDWIVETYQRRVRRMENWHTWFAWHPVKLKHRDWRWLERVDRMLEEKYDHTMMQWQSKYHYKDRNDE